MVELTKRLLITHKTNKVAELTKLTQMQPSLHFSHLFPTLIVALIN